MSKQKVLVIGGSGLLGRTLCPLLLEAGYIVAITSRSGRKIHSEIESICWDYTKGKLPKEALSDHPIVIHLAGASIAEKWTKAHQKEILDSRILPIEELKKSLKAYDLKLHTFLCASAAGYYKQDSSLPPALETEPAATGFLGETCAVWEQSANSLEETHRRIITRFGIILGKGGGMYQELLPMAKLGLISPLGNGKQVIPWIHVLDCAHALMHLLQSPSSGVFNIASPHPQTNEAFGKIFNHSFGRGFWVPSVPSFVLKTILGDRSTLMLDGRALSVQRLLESGFTFKFEQLNDALRDINNAP